MRAVNLLPRESSDAHGLDRSRGLLEGETLRGGAAGERNAALNALNFQLAHVERLREPCVELGTAPREHA